MSFVQLAKSADTNDAATNAVATGAFGAASTATNVIAGHVSWQGTLTTDLTSVTDGTNTYAIIDASVVSVGDSIFMATFLAQNIAGGGTLTVTAHFGTTVGFRRIEAAEYSSVATTGQPHKHAINHSATFGTGTDAVTSGAQTTTIAGCTIFGVAYDESATTIPAVGTGYTSRDTATWAAGDSWRVEDQVQASAGSVAATFTITGGTQSLGVAMLALAPSGGGAANPPPPVPQQAATHYRAPLTMPQRLGIGMAVFLAPANIGPTVPQGNPAQMPAHQARTAYREAAHLVAQPVPPRILQPGAAASPYQPPARVLFTPPAQLWPYTATMLPEPTASVFGITAIYLGKPPLNHPLPQPWPYGTQPRSPIVTQPGAVAAAYLAPNKTNQPLPQPWPYVATMLPEPSSSMWGIPDQDLIFDRLYPLMVAQTPWPYTVAIRLQPSITQPGAAPSVYIAPNAVPVPIMQLWPYVSTMLPEPSSSYWAITVNQILASPVPVPSAPRWPYEPTMLAAPGPASTIQPAQQLGPNPLPMPLVPPWPYALVQSALPAPISQPVAQLLANPIIVPTSAAWPYTLAQLELSDTADLAPNLGVQIPPSPVLQWLTYPPWPMLAAIDPSLPTALAWAPFIPGSPVFPSPSQVLAGVIYGPNGNDFLGTLTGGGTIWIRR